MLLSGQCYPVKSIKYIYDYLNNSYPKPLIDIEKEINKDSWLYSLFQEVRFVHAIDYIHTKYKPGILRKFIVAPIVIAEYLVNTLQKTPYTRLIQCGCRLYVGSAWWILPRGVIEYILLRLKNNDKIIRILKRVWAPEENFFQIMTMASPLSYLAEVASHSQNCMTYANFSTVGKPFKGHPYEFELADFDRLIKMPYLFARKFDETFDASIIDKVDEEINKISAGERNE